MTEQSFEKLKTWQKAHQRDSAFTQWVYHVAQSEKGWGK